MRTQVSAENRFQVVAFSFLQAKYEFVYWRCNKIRYIPVRVNVAKEVFLF